MKLIVLYLFFMLTSAYSHNCIEQRTTALQSNRIGKYVPQCNEQVPEKYKPLQCHSSIGFCWCVTETGEKLSDQFRPWETDERCE